MHGLIWGQECTHGVRGVHGVHGRRRPDMRFAHFVFTVATLLSHAHLLLVALPFSVTTRFTIPLHTLIWPVCRCSTLRSALSEPHPSSSSTS